MSAGIERELGTITAHLENISETQKAQDKRLQSMDERLRDVESKGAVSGAITGGVMSIAIALIGYKFKG